MSFAMDTALSAANRLPVDVGAGHSSLNLTASTAIAGATKVAKVVVVVAGSAAGGVYDCAATGDAAAGNLVATIPAAIGVIALDWALATGLVIVPGTGQTVAVSWS